MGELSLVNLTPRQTFMRMGVERPYTSDVKPLPGTVCTITPDHLGALTAIGSTGTVRLQFQPFESTRPTSGTYGGHSLRFLRLTALVWVAGAPLTHLINTVKE